MDFTIEPYMGALPLTFEMIPQDVEKVLGPPRRVFPHSDGGLHESRRSETGPFKIIYSVSNKKIAFIEFGPGSTLNYKDINLFRQDDPIRILASEDSPKLVESVILFLGLGISLMGFRGVSEEKVIGVFCKGEFDKFKNQMVDYKVP